MKQEFINSVVNRMVTVLDPELLQELKAALNISLDGAEIRKEQTALSTETVRNAEYGRLFLQYMIIKGSSKGTIRQYQMHLRILFEDINKSVLDMTEDDLVLHLTRQKYQRNLSNRYLNLKRAVIRSFFSWMFKKKFIKENHAEYIDRIKYDTKIKMPYSDEERERIRCVCKCERDLALVDVLYSTAARVSELAALDRSDIDFVENGCIVHGKGGKDRQVYLNGSAAYHLREYLQSRTDSGPALFVEVKAPYRRLSKGGIEAILRRLGKSAGMENVHPHRYRRTAITNAVNRGMALQDVQSLAGHASPKTTMLYCAIDQNRVKMEHKMFLPS